NAIQEHLNMWKNMDPAIAAIQNIPPYPHPQAPENKVSESISFKDLPPTGQIQMAKQAGIDLTQPAGAPAPVMPGKPPAPGNPGDPKAPAPNGKDNPTGARHGSVPGVMSAPGGSPNIPPPAMPNLPKGSPAPTQAGFAALQNAIQPPQH